MKAESTISVGEPRLAPHGLDPRELCAEAGVPMSGIDLSVLEAEGDATSPARLEAAWALAFDPGSPRRALAAFGEGWAVSPTDYLCDLADEPPRVLRAASRAEPDALAAEPCPRPSEATWRR